MLFSSFYFLLLFLPLTAAAFWLAGRFSAVGVAVGVLTVASIAFYAVWRPQDVPVLIGSIVANWVLSRLCDRGRPGARAALAVGIVGDLALLFWFKYAVFASIVATSAHVLHHPLADRVLPLGLSFFTFVQIAYLVDRYRGIAPAAGFWKFLLFVCFFPHLIAGPIVHHSTVMPQLDRPRPTGGMVATGLFIFAVGLAKKAVIADPLGAAAKAGFDTAGGLPAVNAWVTVIAYAMQLYFDFSGYSDMAVGLALLFGVEFPWNFLSPVPVDQFGPVLADVARDAGRVPAAVRLLPPRRQPGRAGTHGAEPAADDGDRRHLARGRVDVPAVGGAARRGRWW